ncbi:MAG TPA: type II toxin-antitoxin system HipA family toxin [Candidatus Elarobacter sp.]|nr:type II toxin-antitoxin system HipA family toxin [Candidatus Elarobacter sp.]
MKELEVRLNQTVVGRLINLDGDRNIFTLDPGYVENPRRPVLSQSFQDIRGGLSDVVRPTSRRLPPFFSNLLPEGHLRQYVANRGSVNQDRDFPLIWLLGTDLPGAIIVTDPDGAPLPPTETGAERQSASHPLRFSLAGVQLKFSAVLSRDNGLRIPVEGMGGQWIVKLPSATYGNVPETEYAMMSFAREVGIDVPEVALIPTSRIEGLPSEMRHDLGDAYMIRRFDRTESGGRIHIEDFAQIQGLYPEEKYQRTSYAIMAAIVNEVVGAKGVEEFIRRLVFTIGIGNADMHAKNWSLIYPDGESARIAPAYDFVSTLRYIPDDVLALNLAGTKRWEEFDMERFERLAERAHLSVRQVREIVRETVKRMLDAWARINSDLPIDTATRSIVTELMHTVPVFTGAAAVRRHGAGLATRSASQPEVG